MNPVKDDVWQQDDPCNDDWKFTVYIYICTFYVYVYILIAIATTVPKYLFLL